MNQGLEQQMPSFNLPSKILCKVVNIHLRVSHNLSPQSYWRFSSPSFTYLEIYFALL
jgi:hypothetical protein